MKAIDAIFSVCVVASLLSAAGTLRGDDAKTARAKKEEKPVVFVPAKPDSVVGDWQGGSGSRLVAQVAATAADEYTANLLKAFDEEGRPVAILKGRRSGNDVTFSGDSWTGVVQKGHLSLKKASDAFDLQPVARVSPTAGSSPPEGAVVLFDGHNLDAWAKKAGKDWLAEDGPARWKLVEGGAVEVVPGSDSLISRKAFGDCKVHVEFRTLGSPTNSGVFVQTRYEVNINETYGRRDGTPNGGLDNCSDVKPKIRPSFPPLAWQTLDIDFRAPRFDAARKKTAAARATILLNGVTIYDRQELDVPRGAAARLGEAPTGPLMLQDHGVPVQFRNIWVVEAN
jgi:hypothetical protein